MDLGLRGKVVLVTGSSRGIGLAEARLFSAGGARLAINGVDQARAEAAALRAEGVDAQAFAADVTSSTAVTDLFLRIRERMGECSVLVNNAGLAGRHLGKPVDEITGEDWDKVVDSHLRATWLCTRATLPAMRKAGWGRIVNTSSIHHTGGGRPGLTSYAAAKGAISAFSCTAAKEVGRTASRSTPLRRASCARTCSRACPTDDVWRFMTQPNVPFTNNLAEQTKRMPKIKQKVSG